MIPIDIQVSRSKVKIKSQAYSSYVGEGGISVSQLSIFFANLNGNLCFQASEQVQLKLRTICTKNEDLIAGMI